MTQKPTNVEEKIYLRLTLSISFRMSSFCTKYGPSVTSGLTTHVFYHTNQGLRIVLM